MITNLLLGMSLPLVLGGQGDGTEWSKLAPKEMGFSVLMPGTASEHQATLQTKGGAVDVKYFVAEANRVTYVVSSSTFPKGTSKAETQEKRLDNARDGALATAGGKLESERAVKLQSYPGRELMIAGAKAFVRTRIYAVENHLYQVMAVGSKKQLGGSEQTRFFNSFKLTK